MSIIRYPSVQEVRTLRDEKGVGISQAKRYLEEEAISDAIRRLPELGTDPHVIEVLSAIMGLIKHDRYR
jgi:hypothetical protein